MGVPGEAGMERGERVEKKKARSAQAMLSGRAARNGRQKRGQPTPRRPRSRRGRLIRDTDKPSSEAGRRRRRRERGVGRVDAKLGSRGAAAALAPPLGERERSRRPLGSGAKAFLTPPQVYQGMPQVRTGVGGGGEGAGVACRAGRQSPQCSGRPWGNAVVRSALLVSLTSQPMAGGAGRPDTPTGARPVGTGRAARARRASS